MKGFLKNIMENRQARKRYATITRILANNQYEIIDSSQRRLIVDAASGVYQVSDQVLLIDQLIVGRSRRKMTPKNYRV